MPRARATKARRKIAARRVIRTTGRTGRLSIREIREAVLVVSGKKKST